MKGVALWMKWVLLTYQDEIWELFCGENNEVKIKIVAPPTHTHAPKQILAVYSYLKWWLEDLVWSTLIWFYPILFGLGQRERKLSEK